MSDIKKVSEDDMPDACIPVACAPASIPLCAPTTILSCLPSTLTTCLPNKICAPATVCAPSISAKLRQVSGTYKSTPPKFGTFLELRVDVDGRRPQSRISGDFFMRSFYFGKTLKSKSITTYQYSFVVPNLTVTPAAGEMVLTGVISYYNEPLKVTDTIEVRIPRVSIFAPAADATVRIYTSGTLTVTYTCPKTSELFRAATLEIDRFQAAAFPPSISTHAMPHPAGLANETLTTAEIFRRAGVDMTVVEDDVLNDADSADTGDNWSVAELHDLMETRFDRFANSLQWNVYGVVVPKFGDPNYDSGYYGTMFDWGPWQPGDTFLRQGLAVALTAIRSRTGSPATLYDTDAEKDSLFLETFIHEVGHAFNLPHSWSRSINPSSASNSFMNYAWGYTGGAGGENAFWSNFRWEFDDVELIWMRHADRNKIIFGGENWIGNNLSACPELQAETPDAALSLEIRGSGIYALGQPVRVEFKLKNQAALPIQVNGMLEPEDGAITIYIQRPDGCIVRYIPPVKRLKAPGRRVELKPGEAKYESVLLSYGAKGLQFQEPGEYILRACYQPERGALVISTPYRLRVSPPFDRSSEELAHLLFSPDAAKFIYYNGTSRQTETVSTLTEAAKKHAKTSPLLARQIEAALGMHHSRGMKRVIEKEGRRVVTHRAPNMKEAVAHLEEARALLPAEKAAAVDNITFNRLSQALADSHLAQDHPKKAEQVLRDSMKYLEERDVVKPVIEEYKARIKKLTK